MYDNIIYKGIRWIVREDDEGNLRIDYLKDGHIHDVLFVDKKKESIWEE
jgi:hypothetical protein